MDGFTEKNLKMDTNNGHISFEGKANPDELLDNSQTSPHADIAKKFFSLDGAES